MRVTVQEGVPGAAPPVVGILLFLDANRTQPVMINYVDAMGTQTSDGPHLTQTLTIPDGVTGRLFVYVMADAALAPQSHVIDA